MHAALHILQYLKGSSDVGVFLSAAPSLSLSLSAFCDGDWPACPDTRRSVSGFCIFLGDSLVGWKAKKQPVISLSSAEAKYRALSKVVAELSWTVRLLADLGVPVDLPVPVYCDNQAAIHIACNPVFHERTKHIEVDCHFARQQLLAGLISLHHVSTMAQLADIFTKPITGLHHLSILPKLGVLPHSTLRGGVGPHNKNESAAQLFEGPS